MAVLTLTVAGLDNACVVSDRSQMMHTLEVRLRSLAAANVAELSGHEPTVTACLP